MAKKKDFYNQSISAIENDPFLSYIVNAIKYAAGETV